MPSVIKWTGLVIVASVTGLTVLVSSGCEETTVGLPSEIHALATPTALSVEMPLALATMFDQTASANSTRTEQPNLPELMPLIERIKRSGGELAMGLIRDRSNRPLLRLRIEPPPIAPNRPSNGGNTYEVARRLDQYDADYREFQYKYDIWQQTANERIKVFVEALRALLAQPANARRTDLFNALARADLFLSEASLGFGTTTRPLKMILLVSDGKDNVGAKIPAMRSNARIIVVNGVGSLGSLERLNPPPLQFESFEAAVRFIVTMKGE